MNRSSPGMYLTFEFICIRIRREDRRLKLYLIEPQWMEMGQGEGRKGEGKKKRLLLQRKSSDASDLCPQRALTLGYRVFLRRRVTERSQQSYHKKLGFSDAG
jgi:hypothetical protein